MPDLRRLDMPDWHMCCWLCQLCVGSLSILQWYQSFIGLMVSSSDLVCLTFSTDRAQTPCPLVCYVVCALAVACNPLSVANSNTSAVTGSTGDSLTVACTAGHSSVAGATFTSSCVGVAENTSEWTNVLACVGP